MIQAGLISSGLLWLELCLWGYGSYVAISILFLLIQRNNPAIGARIGAGIPKGISMVFSEAGVILCLIAGSFGFLGGWEARDSRIYRSNNVIVLRRDAPEFYHVRLENGDERNWRFCSPGVDLVPNSFLVYVKLENTGPCQKMLDWKVKRDNRGWPLLVTTSNKGE